VWLLFTDYLPEHVSVTAVGYDVKHKAVQIEHPNDDQTNNQEGQKDKHDTEEGVSDQLF
jgi:hypothetical protein